MTLFLNNRFINDRFDVQNFLLECGMDKFDVQEFISVVNQDEIYKIRVLQDENNMYERQMDGLYSLLNEVLSLCEEQTKKTRLTKSRETFETIEKMINEAI